MKLRGAYFLFLLSPALLLTARSSSASIFTVGSDAACTHDSLAQVVPIAGNGVSADTIRLSNGTIFSALTLNNKRLRIEGGYSSCSAATPIDAQPDSDLTVFSGIGTTGPVIKIQDGNVSLHGLKIVQGNNPNGAGGGLLLTGLAQVRVESSDIENNAARNGAGIAAVDSARVVIGSEVNITLNDASISGGGIYLFGTSSLKMSEPNSAVFQNQADLVAGGIHIQTSGRVEISSGGIDPFGTLFANQAPEGAAIFVLASGLFASTNVWLYSSDPQHPFNIRANGALGSAEIGVNGILSSVAGRLCLRDVNFHGASHAAIEVKDFGAVYWNSPDCPLAIPTDAVHCDHVDTCNVIDNFDSLEPIFGLKDRSQLKIRAVTVRNNQATQLASVGFPSGQAKLQLDDSEISNNLFASNWIQTNSFTQLSMSNNTFAQNAVTAATGAVALQIGDNTTSVTVRDSLMAQPGLPYFSLPLAANTVFSVNNVAVHDASTLPLGSSYSTEPPEYMSSNTGNFQLRENSVFIDRAIERGGFDRLGRTRDLETIDKPNQTGTRDWGAYESQTTHFSNLKLLAYNDSAPVTWQGDAWTWEFEIGNHSLFESHVPIGTQLLKIDLPQTMMSYQNLIWLPNDSTGEISCQIDVSKQLTCHALTDVVIPSFQFILIGVQSQATGFGEILLPRPGGVCRVNTRFEVAETDYTDNNCQDQVIVAQAPDFSVNLQNDVGGLGQVNQDFHWQYTIANDMNAGSYSIAGGTTFFENHLPIDPNISYGPLLVTLSNGASGQVDCALNGGVLKCSAIDVLNMPPSGVINVTLPVTATTPMTLINPPANGICTVDGESVFPDRNRSNNQCADTVKVRSPPDHLFEGGFE